MPFIYSLVIYTISRERRSEDREQASSILATTVNRILEESGIRGLIVNERILNVFKKKISLLQTAFKKVNRLGGKSVKKLLDVWKNGKPYRFKIYYNELEAASLQQQNLLLKKGKRELETELVQEQVKRQKVEEQLEEALQKADRKGSFYKKKFRQMASKIAKLQKNKNTRGPQKKKKFTEYTRQHQARIRKQIKEDCQSTLSFLGLHNFIATKVEVFNSDTNQYETFQLVDDDIVFTDNIQELTDDDMDNINLWIYVKDKFNISNEAWHELSMKSKSIPNMYSIKQKVKLLNSNWNLFATPGEAEGIQISFKESLKEQISRLQTKGDFKDSTIKVKVSGDGTNIGKRLKIVNFTYTILNEKDKAMTEKGNYVLAILKTNEDYDTLRDSLLNLRNEMSSLQSISVNDQSYNVEYFLGGDWKFLACVC